MISKGQVLLFVSNILGTYCAVKTSVLYKAVPGSTKTESISRSIACAYMMMDRSFVAIRIEVSTGICEGLTWDWGTSPQYDNGFSYFVKKTTKEIYDPPFALTVTLSNLDGSNILDRSIALSPVPKIVLYNLYGSTPENEIPNNWYPQTVRFSQLYKNLLLGDRYQWLIPGWFGVGGRFDIYMTPTAESNTYYIRILDTTPTSYNVYDSFPEVILVDIEVKKPLGFVYFKTWQGWWSNKGKCEPFPFNEGIQHKVSIIPDENTLTIMFDEEQAVSYNHPTNPENAKQLQFTFAAGVNVMVNSIHFVGI